MNPPEPTSEQCSTNAPIAWGDSQGFACWYPQMGGYGAKCVVQPMGECFEAFVWHDGEFPFGAVSRPGVPPAHIHHCMAEQFIRFGELIQEKMPGEVAQ